MKKITLAAALVLLGTTVTVWADSVFADINYQVKQSDTVEGIGFGAYQLKDQGSGYYLNGTIGLPPEGYSSYSYFSPSFTERGRVPYIANVGATFAAVGPGSQVPFYQTIHSYIGIGYGTLEGIGKHSSGSWYDDATYTKNGVNLNGGFILGFANFGINLGFNSLSKTMYIGIGMKTGGK
jgi:hypothetical protein